MAGSRLWLARYWDQEEQVAARAAASGRRHRRTTSTSRLLTAGLSRLFPAPATPTSERRPRRCALSRVSVLAGGPGTGKTTTVSRLLALLREQHPDWRIALAAPTGKAAARLEEAVRSSTADAAGGGPAAARRAAGHDAAPAARLAAGGAQPVPARPHQPAAGRGRRGRRGVDGVADDDGPAARGVAAVDPAGAGGRPRPARVGRGRRRARRPGGRLAAPSSCARSRRATAAGSRVAVAPVDQPALPGRPAASRCWPPLSRRAAARTLSTCCARPTPPRSSSSRSPTARTCRPPSSTAYAPMSSSAARHCSTPPNAVTRPPPSRRSTGTGCCARTAAALAACSTGARSPPAGSTTSTRSLPRADGRYAGEPLMVTANDYEIGLYNGDTGVVVDDGQRRADGSLRPRRRPDRRCRSSGSARCGRCTR